MKKLYILWTRGSQRRILSRSEGRDTIKDSERSLGVENVVTWKAREESLPTEEGVVDSVKCSEVRSDKK